MSKQNNLSDYLSNLAQSIKIVTDNDGDINAQNFANIIYQQMFARHHVYIGYGESIKFGCETLDAIGYNHNLIFFRVINYEDIQAPPTCQLYGRGILSENFTSSSGAIFGVVGKIDTGQIFAIAWGDNNSAYIYALHGDEPYIKLISNSNRSSDPILIEYSVII